MACTRPRARRRDSGASGDAGIIRLCAQEKPHACRPEGADVRRRPSRPRAFPGRSPRRQPRDPPHEVDRAQHPARVRGDGHGDGSPPRDRDGAGRRPRHHPQEHAGRPPGGRGGEGQALRERSRQGPADHSADDVGARRDGVEARAPFLGTAGRRGPEGRRHRHQSRPALRDESRPARQRNHDQGRQARHGARRRRPRAREGADAPAPARARAGRQPAMASSRDSSPSRTSSSRPSIRSRARTNTDGCAPARRSASRRTTRSASRRSSPPGSTSSSSTPRTGTRRACSTACSG